MTTTAVRTPSAVLRRGGDVMNERIAIAPRQGDNPPRPEDAAWVGHLRRIATAKLNHWGLGALAGDVSLISSEFLTNAVLHSGATHIMLKLAVRDGCLHITVIDGMPGCAVLTDPGDDSESGRGLWLVDLLAKERGGTWGTRADGAETWCALPLPADECA
ncbi:ATP-binding protein [Streptomyces sp. NPDC007991]|uniref:ATP-binding protein n=1 Tax=Streptomyces sp. NPDC007991 TaxID=3364803 RepID=UPI0036EAD15A